MTDGLPDSIIIITCAQDEPTSGLDARAAAIVMRTGRLILHNLIICSGT